MFATEEKHKNTQHVLFSVLSIFIYQR